MVTLGRIEFIKRSIQCYCDQTYENRELIILTNAKTEIVTQLIDCIASFDRTDIQLETLSDKIYTLGELRNHSIQKATGSIVCIWDDDDLYHPERLMLQYHNMIESNAEASLLTSYLHFFWTDLKLGWSDWQSNFPAPINGLPGSLMMYKDTAAKYPENGDFANAGEDSFLLYRLYSDGVKIAKLLDNAHLYLYSFHGNNTWAKEHHERLFYYFHKKSKTLSEQQKNQLTSGLNYFQLPEGVILI